MPRRPRPSVQVLDIDPEHMIEWQDTNVNPEIKEPCRPVKDFLKNNYFKLLKEKNDKIECSVCLEEIDCPKCYYLLNCGHSFHIGCAIRCNFCPLCRQ
jgi:hypothetical protein